MKNNMGENIDRGWREEEALFGLDKNQDQLEDWRKDKEGTPLGKSYDITENMLNEEESVLLEKEIENDPDNHAGYWRDAEDIPDGDDIYQFIASEFPDTVSEDLIDDFYVYHTDVTGQSSRAYKDKEAYFKANAPEEIQQMHEVPFEERDILKESLAETRAARQAKKSAASKENQERKEITPEEFAFMEECAKFKSLTENTKTMAELIKDRPVFADKKPLTDEQIAEQANRWRECKEKKLYNKYTQSDIAFMRQCGHWMFWYRKFTEKQKNPVFSGTNTPLSSAQINELAKEYSDLKRNNPESFADLKYETGQWGKGNFRWNETPFKGKKEWYCWTKRIVNGKELNKKYVSDREPLQKSGTVYYVTKRTFSGIDKNKTPYQIIFVDIKHPKKVPEKKIAYEPA